MACPNCKKPAKAKETSGPAGPAMDLSYTTSETTVVGRDGKHHAIGRCLVPSNVKPRGGWGVVLDIHGQAVPIKGKSAGEVASKAMNALVVNGASIPPLILWLNLNIQWLERCSTKYLVVRPHDLLYVARGTDSAEPTPANHRARVHPNRWISKGWGMLEMYLALDTYNWGTFLGLASELRKWFDPAANPTTGDATIFRNYTMALQELRKKTPYEQDEARTWLYETREFFDTQEGIESPTYEETAETNNWI